MQVCNRVIVVGAGASGMLAAGRAAELGADVLLLEKTDQPGAKLLMTGNGRCNLTNARDLDSFVDQFGPNGNFLRGVFVRFFREELLVLLRRYGINTCTEPTGRIFPLSGNARQVLRSLERYLSDHRVRLQTGAGVTELLAENGRIAGVRAGNGFFPASAVVMATGGASHPQTGSTGDGYRLAADAGHTIVPLRPALVPLVVAEANKAMALRGVSLRNIRMTAFQCPAEEIDPSLAPLADVGRGISGTHSEPPVIESRTGDAIITHFGLSGPVTLLISLAVVDALANGPVSISIDMYPGISLRELEQRLDVDFNPADRHNRYSPLRECVPLNLASRLLGLAGAPAWADQRQVTPEQRKRLAGLMKSLCFNVKVSYSMATAVVTAGGVSLAETDQLTMGSRRIPGLYFCGEVLDIDAPTGGYNLQAAFSTGYVAGESAATYVMARP